VQLAGELAPFGGNEPLADVVVVQRHNGLARENGEAPQIEVVHLKRGPVDVVLHGDKHGLRSPSDLQGRVHLPRPEDGGGDICPRPPHGGTDVGG
jgi:2',3'-cyclic-nucleotide 2'-phosphodiesterase (5'-nucleotidase family)